MIYFHLAYGKRHGRHDISDGFEQRPGKDVHEAVLGITQLDEIPQFRWAPKKRSRDTDVLFHDTLVCKFVLKNISPFDGYIKRTRLG